MSKVIPQLITLMQNRRAMPDQSSIVIFAIFTDDVQDFIVLDFDERIFHLEQWSLIFINFIVVDSISNSVGIKRFGIAKKG